MALNTIAYAQVLQSKLDEKAVATLTSGWMEENAGQVIYNGGREVKIPKISLSGLKDYDRDNGYPQGAVTLEYETREMSKDRGTSFLLDSQNVNESNFIANATTVAGEFQRVRVVPEIDAYRYSKIAALADAGKHTYTPTADTIFDALIDDIAKVRDIIGDDEELVITINTLAKAQLEKIKEFKAAAGAADFKIGEITTKVKMLNDCVLLGVPSVRMKTSYIFADGSTDGQKEGGFTVGSSAKQINWIIMPKRAPIAISKQDKMKIIDPDTYQKADAWFLGYRKYHDIWIKDNMLETILPNVEA